MAPWRARASRSVLLAGLWVCVVAAGCGASDDELRRDLAARRALFFQLVEQDDVARERPGSPQRAVVELWRALQFRDAQRAVELAVAPPGGDRMRQAEEVVRVDRRIASARPESLEVAREDGRARVLVDVARIEPLGSYAFRRTTRQLALIVEHRGGRWRVVLDMAKIDRSIRTEES